MSEATLAKGVMFGQCFTTGCTNSGSEVKGIPGQANMWGPDANHQHRCTRCRELIKGAMDTALSYTMMDTGQSREQAANDQAFVNVGKQLLTMDLDQLRGARI